MAVNKHDSNHGFNPATYFLYNNKKRLVRSLY